MSTSGSSTLSSHTLERAGTVREMVSSRWMAPRLSRRAHLTTKALSCRVEGDEIVVTAQAYAKSVEVQNENEDLLLSDNYFDMNAGETRVKVLSGSTENLRLRSVYDIH